MVATDPIKLAQEIIGAGKENDYVIAPTQHADEFKAKAPALSDILSSSAVNAAASNYEDSDREARVAQVEFKRVFNRSNKTVLFTAFLIALVMATGVLTPWPVPLVLAKVLLIVLGVASVLTGAMAAYDLNTLRQGDLFKDWMSNRALAETGRLEYFSSVAKSAAGSGEGEVPIDLLKLEYFRRFQLDVQRNFYRARSREHRQEAKRTLSYSGFAIAGAAVVTGLAGTLGFISPKFAAFAALGTACAAFSSFAAMREQVYQDQRNAERYGRTAQALQGITAKLDDVRKGVKEAGQEPLLAFIEAVHEQLSLEHRQWVGQQTDAENAFTRLQDTLTKISSQASGKKTG
jgi:hypothetical protein